MHRYTGAQCLVAKGSCCSFGMTEAFDAGGGCFHMCWWTRVGPGGILTLMLGSVSNIPFDVVQCIHLSAYVGQSSVLVPFPPFVVV